MQNPEFREIVSTEYATIRTPYRKIPLASTYELLFSYRPRASGPVRPRPQERTWCPRPLSETSRTYACSSTQKKTASQPRYGFTAYDLKDLVVEGKRYASIDVPYRRRESVDLVAQESVDGLVDASPNVERDVELVKDPPPSARVGTKLGEVVVKVDGETRLVAKKGYEEPSLGQRVWYTVEGIFQ
jgi:serine-type D-Ala-D-Ala carboxypeptidase (penicillin-binding protein 5/6)